MKKDTKAKKELLAEIVDLQRGLEASEGCIVDSDNTVLLLSASVCVL
jgi:hypothetical protein